MKNKYWLITAMILIPIIGLMFNIYAIFLFLPLGFLYRKHEQ